MSKAFGARLRAHRLRAKLTQRDLAEALGLDFTYVSKIEGGRVPPPAEGKIELAAKVLKLSADDREELFSLAKRVPSDIEEVVARPKSLRLYRNIRQHSVEEQDKLLDELLEFIERKQSRKPKA